MCVVMLPVWRNVSVVAGSDTRNVAMCAVAFGMRKCTHLVYMKATLIMCEIHNIITRVECVS